MLRAHTLAFDDWIEPSAVWHFTSDDLVDELGLYDAFAVAIVVDQGAFTAGTTIEARVDYSSNRIHWEETQMVITASLDSLPAIGWESSPASSPRPPFMRIALRGNPWLGSFTRARVRLYVTQRDSGAMAPKARKERRGSR
jgi:hypothetical protein